jgi:hypothetical protein
MKTKIVEVYKSHSVPPLWYPLSDYLWNLGLTNHALFGGAIRDTNLRCKINDYDVRGWLHPNQLPDFLERLKFDSNVVETPSLGTGIIRYVFDFENRPVDLSIRPIPNEFTKMTIPMDAVAKERATASDIGLSSVATDPDGITYATLEYVQDCANHTITVYPSDNLERSAYYADKMSKRFPTFKIVYL